MLQTLSSSNSRDHYCNHLVGHHSEPFQLATLIGGMKGVCREGGLQHAIEVPGGFPCGKRGMRVVIPLRFCHARLRIRLVCVSRADRRVLFLHT